VVLDSIVIQVTGADPEIFALRLEMLIVATVAIVRLAFDAAR
jgi:hypothetical protein